jgi:protein-disulfide isomerase
MQEVPVRRRFTITYDYLCPFARIANEAVVEAIQGGAPYDVTFAPFSLHHNSLPDGATPVWERSEDEDLGSGVSALLWSIAVRDSEPVRFPSFHVAMFSARHDDGDDLTDPAVLVSVAAASGIDPASIEAIVASGVPMKTLRQEHTALVNDYKVFGVPTFISNDEAVFVRMMERHQLDDLAKVVDMIDWTNVNEFKRTSISR